ncbi:hypothetical protein [Spirosoma fluviale]|uniref:Uncharacterized protein n=1 Tax=Spirosoma fluviale TaxID=1597977 RepID=A0A286FZL2_9BACT|nr:hypothetical protein [Spirosoma fluviale]SOD88695.1 hypothetical protein SAMN06269250_2796 [Spirosoma fluviale]
MQYDLRYLYTPTPVWLDLFFAATTLATFVMLILAVRRTLPTQAVSSLVGLISVWLAGLGLLAFTNFFQRLDTTPPHFIVAIGPPLLVIIGLFSTAKSRSWLSRLPLSNLTYLHIVRIPVELTLYGLYLYHQVPQLMTFEGGNYDILSGLTAPIVAYYTFRKRQIAPRWLLVWNVVALGLVLNIVILAVLSAPLPFQQLAFEQPNVGVLKLPYIWLPGFIVPSVLFSHGVAIFQLLSVNQPTHNSYKSDKTRAE